MELKLNKKLLDFELNTESGNPELIFDNENTAYKLKKTGDNVYSIYLDGRYVHSYAAEDDKNIYVQIDGKQFVFEKTSDEDKSFDEAAGGSADREAILPPMPGSIVQVLVEKGQKVKNGDALIIVEAMKMETSLYCSIDGIVTEINVKAGEQVDATKELVVVEKEEADKT